MIGNEYFFILILFILFAFINKYINTTNNKVTNKKRGKYEEYDQSKYSSRKEWYSNSYLESSHWKKVRNKALVQGGFCCSNCGNKSNLQVHHLTYARIGNERSRDLMVLCRKCHKKVHGI